MALMPQLLPNGVGPADVLTLFVIVLILISPAIWCDRRRP